MVAWCRIGRRYHLRILRFGSRWSVRRPRGEWSIALRARRCRVITSYSIHYTKLYDSATPETVLATARRAGEAMTQHGVLPHPRNYALWYAYCAGTMLPLNRAIDAAIAAGQPFTEARCASLHARFVADPEPDSGLEAASESVRQSVLRAMEYVGTAHRTASDYGRTIEAVSDRLYAGETDDLALVLV